MNLNDVSHKYDRASSIYDGLTELVFGRLLGVERLRENALGFRGDLAGATVVDVRCDTGCNLPSLVRRVGRSGRVIGVDASEGMLDKRSRASRPSVGRT